MYLECFADLEDMARSFEIDPSQLEGCRILFASYVAGGYEGSALVIYEREGKLYEVNGSHCSCYGLENQWEPEETSMEALKMRDLKAYGFDKDVENLFIDLVFERDVLEN